MNSLQNAKTKTAAAALPRNEPRDFLLCFRLEDDAGIIELLTAVLGSLRWSLLAIFLDGEVVASLAFVR